MKDEKILNEEVLSDEELEGVAGGADDETLKDAQFLNKLGLADWRISMNDIKEARSDAEGYLAGAFSEVGISVEYSEKGKNVYREIVGNGLSHPITQAQAYAIVKDNLSHRKG